MVLHPSSPERRRRSDDGGVPALQNQYYFLLNGARKHAPLATVWRWHTSYTLDLIVNSRGIRVTLCRVVVFVLDPGSERDWVETHSGIDLWGCGKHQHAKGRQIIMLDVQRFNSEEPGVVTFWIAGRCWQLSGETYAIHLAVDNSTKKKRKRLEQ